MGARTVIYPIRVVVKDEHNINYRSSLGMYVQREVTKMFHIEASSLSQAYEKAKRYGRPISGKKTTIQSTIERMASTVEAKGKDGEYLILKDNTLYPNAIAMSEMIWKRNKQREYLKKDKESID